MLKIRGISNTENFLMGVNRFGHCLTVSVSGRWVGQDLLSKQEKLEASFIHLGKVG